MSIFNFPANPSLNDTYTENGIVFKWNGAIWERTNTGTGPQGNQGLQGVQGAQGATSNRL